MINYDDIRKETIKIEKKKTYIHWFQIFDYPCRSFIIGGFASGKTNKLLYPIKQHNDNDYSIIDKICLYIKDPNEVKYQYLIKKHEEIGLEECEEDSWAFLLNIQIMCRMSVKLLKGTTHIENVKYK